LAPEQTRGKVVATPGHDGQRLERVRLYRSQGVNGRIVHGDALLFLRSLDDGIADIVFLDPPFNLGKKYSDSNPSLDRRPDDEYAEWLFAVLNESARVIAPGGALYLYHLPKWAMRAGTQLETAGLRFHQWIAVMMKNGFVRGQRLYPANYALLLFTKGKPKRFERPRFPAPRCRHCGKYTKDYGGYRPIIDRQGVNLSDFWEDLSPVRHPSRKHRGANELPKMLFDRVVAISGAPDALYVDPFAGSGTGALCALSADLRFAVCDLVRANCEIIQSRLDHLISSRRGKCPSTRTRSHGSGSSSRCSPATSRSKAASWT